MPSRRLGVRRRSLPVLLGLAAAVFACGGPATAQPLADTPLTYQVPPQPIARALEAPAPPFVLLSPSRDRIALLARPGLPPIAELAEPELGLAGATINPANNGPSRASSYSGITFTDLHTGKSHEVALPAHARLISPQWSPDGRRLAFLILGEEAVGMFREPVAGQSGVDNRHRSPRPRDIHRRGQSGKAPADDDGVMTHEHAPDREIRREDRGVSERRRSARPA